MRCITLMFDTLNRRHLSPYGCDWVHTPNFQRLADRTVTFDTSYVCSMPCMPARRDFHTGRPNFLHRSWGPLEPFDDSMPAMLDSHGIHSCLISDHKHYWEDGGATYHTRYSSWQCIRGQEGDPWMGQVAPEPIDPRAIRRNVGAYCNGARQSSVYQDRINRKFAVSEDQFPISQTFAAGLDFIERNHADDHWLLHLETFDPHEPFRASDEYKKIYQAHYDAWEKNDGRIWDWPDYRPTNDSDTPELTEHMRHEYASLLSMCDAKLGQVLDMMDEHHMWEDTMLVVWTDHGFLLNEHDWWAKSRTPWWEELARTPFFMWDPRTGKRGERRNALVQPAIDLPVTLLKYFGLDATPDMVGCDLADTLASDAPVREAAIFGNHGGHVNITDGRYVYMRSAANACNSPLYDYTLMPTHMNHPFGVDELRDRIELVEPFDFTKGCKVMKIGASPAEQKKCDPSPWFPSVTKPSLLYDLQNDPAQENTLQDPSIEQRMTELLIREMQRVDAPVEQYERLGLSE